MLRRLSVALFAVVLAAAADWPRFRGPDGTGISPEKGLPTTWGQSQNLAWKVDLPGPGSSSPVFFGNHIFLTCWTGYRVPGQAPGDPKDLKRMLLCLDRKTGKEVWRKEVPPKLPEVTLSREGDGYASSTPVVDAAGVYCFFGKSGVFAFDHAGKKLWDADVGSGIGPWASAASPFMYGDLVIVNASLESESVVALDKKTGKERWRVKGIKEAWNTPVVGKNKAGRDELVIPAAKKVYGVDPKTGAALWNCNTDITWYMVPSAVVHDGVAYVLGGRSGVIGLAVRLGGKGDVTSSNRLWTSKKGSNVSSPVFHEGHVYWMNDANGTAYCAKADTGDIVYEERIPRAGRTYASSLLADGKIYYVGGDGKTFVVAAKPKFELLATNDLGDRSSFDATPVAIDGRVFVRSNKGLYCVGK